MAERGLYALVAEFDRADALLEAARQARKAGYRRFEAYSPFPIEGLAEFYVMGWSKDPCTSDPPPPGGGSGQGQVWGYFIQPVVQNPTAIGGGKCTTTTFGPCVAVLTR